MSTQEIESQITEKRLQRIAAIEQAEAISQYVAPYLQEREKLAHASMQLQQEVATLNAELAQAKAAEQAKKDEPAKATKEV